MDARLEPISVMVQEQYEFKILDQQWQMISF